MTAFEGLLDGVVVLLQHGIDRVDETLTVGDAVIRFEDIITLEADGIIEEDWGSECP